MAVDRDDEYFPTDPLDRPEPSSAVTPYEAINPLFRLSQSTKSDEIPHLLRASKTHGVVWTSTASSPRLTPSCSRDTATGNKILDRLSLPRKLHLVDKIQQSPSSVLQPISLPPSPPASEKDDTPPVLPPKQNSSETALIFSSIVTEPTPTKEELSSPSSSVYMTPLSLDTQTFQSLGGQLSPGSTIKKSKTSSSSNYEQGSSIASTSTPSYSTRSRSGGRLRALSYAPSSSSYFAAAPINTSGLSESTQLTASPIDYDSSTAFEDSIAKEADEIRKERQNKKLLAASKQTRSLSRSSFRPSSSVSNGQLSEDEEHPPSTAGPLTAQVKEHATPKTAQNALERSHALAQATAQPVAQRRLSDKAIDGEKPLVGNLIGEDHVNYVLMYNMLTGIRIGVSRCQAKMKRPLTDEDYQAVHKFSFDIVGNELTPSARYDFKFKDYAPWVFRELREHFLLDPADYLLSLTAKYILSELGSPGKSGSFFYFSRDYRFIIKTIHHAEHKFLRKILKQYYDHVKANPHTLISRFYGLHRVKLPRGRKIHFVIMNNLMPPHRDIHEVYDLKGSTVSREYPEEKAKQNPSATLKDLNWIHRHKTIELGPEKAFLFSEQLAQDTKLLQRLRIMDYSLLIAAHDITRGNKEKIREGALTVFNPETSKLRRRQTQIKREREQDASELRKVVAGSDPKAINEKNRLPNSDRSERRHFIFYQDEGGLRATNDLNEPIDLIYYLGIIDILTPYGWKKWFETFFKGFVHDRHAISPVPPKEYGDRFFKFITTNIRGNHEEMKEKRTKRLSILSKDKEKVQ